MVNRITAVQVCDATKAHSSNTAGIMFITLILLSFSLASYPFAHSRNEGREFLFHQYLRKARTVFSKSPLSEEI